MIGQLDQRQQIRKASFLVLFVQTTFCVIVYHAKQTDRVDESTFLIEKYNTFLPQNLKWW